MKRYRFRALVSLDPPGKDHPPRVYPCGTHSLMVRSCRLGDPALCRYFPATIYRADECPLRPGDRDVLVTIEVTDDAACDFLGPGQEVSLWNGTDVGRGVVSRRAFFTWAI